MVYRRKKICPAPKRVVPKSQALPASLAGAFITLHSKSIQFEDLLRKLGRSKSQLTAEKRSTLNAKEAKKVKFIVIPAAAPKAEPRSPHPSSIDTSIPAEEQVPEQPPDMKTRGAWDKNLANANRLVSVDIKSESDDDASPQPTNNKRTIAIHLRGPALRRPDDVYEDGLEVHSVKRRRTKKKTVTFVSHPVLLSEEEEADREDSPVYSDIDERSDKENNTHDQDEMQAPARPQLKLKLSTQQFQQPASSPPSETPTVRLSFGPKTKDGPSKKKRKREDSVAGQSMVTPLSAGPKIKFKSNAPEQTPITPAVTLKTKGRVQKRKPGVGYDSELSESERDPVILEGFMLRMQPGPDCDYIKEAIAKGTMGVSKMQGGAEVSVRALDDKGRRCVIRVRQNQYAATLVDLPCVIEGMKSWDNKRFIKSIDVCQMMIVLGRVQNDEEAKAFPLPEGVSKTYAYAHGVTAPMQWVRKRRFDRTRRKPVDRIEHIDKKVHQLLQADAAAISSSYQILDYDPQEGEDEEEETDEEEDEDADGEEEDYFDYEPHPDQAQRVIGEEEVDEFTNLLQANEDDEDDEDTNMVDSAPDIASGRQVDSSGFATSNAASPDVTNSAAPTAAATPAGEVSTPAGPSEAEAGDESDDADGDDDDGENEEQNEQDEKNAATKERIQTLQTKIDEQTKQLGTQSSNLIRKRIAQNITKLENEISMLNRELVGDKKDDDDDDEGDDGDD